MSDELIEQYKLLHAKNPGYGRAATYLKEIEKLINENQYETAIDYGCGKGLLGQKLSIPCYNYDPAIEEYSKYPEQKADIVICNDVLEHLTIDTYKSILSNIVDLAKNCAFFNISCRPAVHKLPDGRNCHTLVKDQDWWIKELFSFFNQVGLHPYLTKWNPNNKNLLIVFKSVIKY